MNQVRDNGYLAFRFCQCPECGEECHKPKEEGDESKGWSCCGCAAVHCGHTMLEMGEA